MYRSDLDDVRVPTQCKESVRQRSSELRLQLLGGLSATLDGESITGFDSTKIQALLVYLAVTARPQSRATLATLFWGDRPDSAAQTSLRRALSNLRRLVGPHLSISRRTVAFDRDARYFLDTEAFLAWRTHRADMERVRAAVEFYRGDFLEGFEVRNAPLFEEWVSEQREALRQAAVEGFGALGRLAVERQAYRAAIEATRRILALDPWREETHRELMRLLAVTGQRSAALVQYEQCRRILAEELGVEPEPATIALRDQLDRGTGPLAPAPPDDGPPPRANRLPAPLTTFIGREAELALVAKHIARRDCRLVTILGPGGIGKTRLALQIAWEHVFAFSDGTHFLPLASVTSGEVLIPTIAGAFGLALSGPLPPAEQLMRNLRHRQALLVLDNFEHLLSGGGAEILCEILRAAPGIRMLVTSRERLQVQAEWILPLEGLSYPSNGATCDDEEASYPAVRLFVERARQVRPDFRPAPPVLEKVVRICEMVEGTPLGIELAAAQMEHASPAEIADEVARTMDALTATLRDLPPRQRAVRASFEYSWNLLAEVEQRVFSRLSVFRGGFTLEAAQQVCEDQVVEPVLARLLNKSLVKQHSTGRYELHNLVAQFAEEKLVCGDEIRARHAEYYLALAETGQHKLRTPERATWLSIYDREHNNVRAALAWALGRSERGDLALRLCAGMCNFWIARNHYLEGEQWITAALDAATGRGEWYARCLFARASMAYGLGDAHGIDRFAGEALAMSRELGDRKLEVECLNVLGLSAELQSEYPRAQALFTQLVAVTRTLDLERGTGIALNNLGMTLMNQADFEAARATLEEALELGRRIGDAYVITSSCGNLGRLAFLRNDPERAVRYYDEGLALARELGNRASEAKFLLVQGDLALARNDVAGARELLLESMALCRQVGNQRDICICLDGLAKVDILTGRAERAATLLGAVEAARETLGLRPSAIDLQDYEPYVEKVRALLPEPRFTTAWSQGRTMSLEEAVACALRE